MFKGLRSCLLVLFLGGLWFGVGGMRSNSIERGQNESCSVHDCAVLSVACFSTSPSAESLGIVELNPKP